MYVSDWVTEGGGGPFEVAKACRCVLKVSTSLTPLLQALNDGILNMHTFKGVWPIEARGRGGWLTRTSRCLTANPLQRGKQGNRHTGQSNTSLHLRRKIPTESKAESARGSPSNVIPVAERRADTDGKRL